MEIALTTPTRKTYVLIHGAWYGGWLWQRVADILVSHGHTVHAPTLTGVGERSHLARANVNLTTHILDVVNEVRWKDLDQIVLCGHSYAGMVITGAAEQIQDRIASIVYVDAFVPQNGQSLNDIVGQVSPAEDGLVAPITAEQFSVSPENRNWVDAKATPQSAACFSQVLAVTGAAERIPRKTYVMAALGTLPPFRAAYDRLSKDSSWRTYAVGCGHDIMIDRPVELADLLMGAL